jgi:hypothetical protein
MLSLTASFASRRGTVVSDDRDAPAVEIGRRGETYRHVRLSSDFGKLVALVTDGRLPFPYGREITVTKLQTLARL